jgi:predicted transcriptional regulator
MKTRNYLIRIDAELDEKLRELRKLGYLPAALVRKAIAEAVEKKLAEAKGREK